MKNLAIKILLLFFFYVPAIAQSEYPVTIECDSSMNVRIDGKFIGETPVKINLTRGKHFVYMYSDAKIWGEEKLADTIYVSSKSDRVFQYNYPGGRLIESAPSDALIEARGLKLGYTPLTIHSGFENISLTKKGYKKVNVKTAGLNSPIILTGLSPQLAAKEKFVQSKWFKIAISSMVLFGASAAYFKTNADKKYDEYKISRSPADYEKVKVYDKSAAVSLTFLEVNIAAILYFLLTDYL